MSGRAPARALRPAGFFVLRTPLLESERVARWAARPETVVEAFREPVVREALLLSSPSLVRALDASRDGADDPEARAAGLRYALRMATRPTPFAICAGVSVGEVGATTELQLPPIPESVRHVRLDCGVACSIVRSSLRTPELRDRLVLVPNSSLYESRGLLRYAILDVLELGVEKSPVAEVAPTPTLRRALAAAAEGVTRPALARELADGSPDRLPRALAFVDRLIDSELLIPQGLPVLTKTDPLAALEEDLVEGAPLEAIVALRRAIDAVSRLPLREVAAYHLVRERLPLAEDDKPALSNCVQVDLVRPAERATLGPAVVRELERVALLLASLPRQDGEGELSRFSKDFLARFELQEVPLTDALDEDLGVGWPAGDDALSLLREIETRAEPPSSVRAHPKLLRWLLDALAERRDVVHLRDEDVVSGEAPPLPSSFVIFTRLVGTPGELDSGHFNLYGPLLEAGSERLLGRFCHLDAKLHDGVRALCESECREHGDDVVAELVHLPAGRIGNVVLRPSLWPYEIAYHGRSAAPRERQIDVSDLVVRAGADGRIELRSRRLGKRVRVRMSNAHNTQHPTSLPIYRFLAAIAAQDLVSFGFSWGALASSPFLPRVESGRTVLAPATWTLTRDRLEWAKAKDVSGELARLREELRIPAAVSLVEGDNLLPLDLETQDGVSLLQRATRRGSAVRLEEASWKLPAPVAGPSGTFHAELIVPFVRGASSSPGSTSPGGRERPTSFARPARSFVPGSDVLYAKIYVDRASVEPLLSEVQAEYADDEPRWFFIRYADPSLHVRLRFFGAGGSRLASTFERLRRVVAPHEESGRAYRIQLDTYERELERYGGVDATALAERLFCADSTCAIALFGISEATERWLVTAASVDALLDDLGLDVDAKIALIERAAAAYASEHRVSIEFHHNIGRRFREERDQLTSVVLGRALPDGSDALASALAIRSSAIRPLVAKIEAASSVPLEELALSYVHMTACRLLPTSLRAQELVLYHLLQKLYRGARARAVSQ